MKKLIFILIFIFSFLFLSNSGTENINSGFMLGTYENPIIDSNMTIIQAMEGLSSQCPVNIKERQRLVTVKYYSFDNKIHQGQLLIDKDLVEDIILIFDLILSERFPIHSVIPISHISFRRNGRWDDNASMEANNSSGFNYRTIAGTQTLSKHATGRAFDINPVQNPYITSNAILPFNSVYNPRAPGTLTNDNIIVKTLIARGWTWGGNWTNLKDYQHFEK